MTTDKLNQNFFQRHLDKIEIGAPTGCWLWTAAKNGKGYGRVWAGGKARKAHREAYEAIHGEGSADGLVVRHRCDVPACVNPAHMEPGTHADNNRDRDERGRQAKGECVGRAKLNEADVLAIRAAYVRGHREFSLRALARRFGVSQSAIGFVVNRQRWAHVA